MTLDDFFDYVEAYWAQAEQHGGFRTATGVPTMLGAIRDSHPSVEKHPEDKNAANRPYKSGYLPERRLLWIRRAELTRLAKAIGMPDYARDFVNEKDVFIRLTTALAMNGDVDQLARRGAVLVGRSDARTSKDILWIGITPDRELARLSLSKRAAGLRSPISRYVARERLSWATNADVVGGIAHATSAATRQVTQELFGPNLTAVKENIDLLHDGSHDEQILWHAPGGADDLKSILKERDLPVIVAGCETFDELRTMVTMMCSADASLAGTPFAILDRDRLADELSHLPWVWSKYFAPNMPFAIVEDGDEARMRKVLGIAQDAPLVAHPAVTRCLNERRVRFEGRMGSGKTCAVLQAFRDTPQHAIVLRASAEERHIELCDAILSEVLADRALIIMDDLEQQAFDTAVRSPLGRLISRLHTRGNEANRIVVTYDSGARAKVEQHFGSYLAEFTAAVALDNPRHAFIVDVLRATAAASGVEVDEYALQRTATILQRWENTPAAAARYVFAHDAGSHLRIPETIKDMPNVPPQATTGDARFVLRIIAALRAAGVDEPAIVTVGLLFEHFIGGNDYARFEEAVRTLVEERRIRTTILSISLAGAELEPLMAAEESDFQRRFSEAVDAVLDGIDERDRRSLLFSEGERALGLGQSDRGLRLLERLRSEAPGLFADYQERFAMGFLRAADGETAVRYLEEYVVQHPEEMPWKTVLQFLSALSPAEQRRLVKLGAIDALLSVFLRPERATPRELDALLDALTTERTDDTPDEQVRRDRVISRIRAWRGQLV
jgi:hypothetical protein